jgi:hypothetical protein
MKQFIPRPLVRANQASLVISVLLFGVSGAWVWLLIPLISGLSSLFTGKHPIMWIAQRFLRQPLSTYVQEDRREQRFSQILAVVLLSAAVLSSLAGWSLLAFLFAGMVFLAALVAMLGFCVGCFIQYQWRQYRYRKHLLAQ